MNTIAQILNERVITILRGLQEEQVLKTMEALREGGLHLVEITFDQRKNASITAAIIKKACAEFGSSMRIGAGTVMTEEQLFAARDAGAQYILTPQTDTNIIKTAHEIGLVTMPGAFTPTEIALCYAAGADIVKVFPAGTVGPAYIKAVRGPMPHIRLSAVGGVNLENIRDFFDAGVCSVGIGSNIVDNHAIHSGNYKKITELAVAYREKAGNGASQ